jgi:hypothetical protein
MHIRLWWVTCSLALILIATPVRAQRAEDLMDRVADWIHEFVEQFANVVAEEEYVPNRVYQSPRLRSDYLLVRYPGSSSNWQTFRDVVAVNGSSLRNQPERLSKLFVEPFESAATQANAITKHSAEYISPLSDPLLGIAVLQRQYQPRFRFTLGDRDEGLGAGVRRVRFEERDTPTILRQSDGHDLPTHGTAWAVEATGRILRTELHIGEAGRYARTVILSTTFTLDEALGAYVPATMQEGFTLRDTTGVKGTAYYSRFRRFTVGTRETIDVPKP